MLEGGGGLMTNLNLLLRGINGNWIFVLPIAVFVHGGYRFTSIMLKRLIANFIPKVENN
jgi:hypothetical protein